MQRLLSNSATLLTLAIICSSISAYADWGSTSWLWFQRSGSAVTLIGAILSYRSIVRLGKRGVGGAQPTALMGKGISVDDSGPVQKITLFYDDLTKTMLTEAARDNLAGYIGACLVIVGTAIWGYGDLLGIIFK